MLASEFHDRGGGGEPHEPFGNEVELVFSTAHQLRTSSYSRGPQLVGKSWRNFNFPQNPFFLLHHGAIPTAPIGV